MAERMSIVLSWKDDVSIPILRKVIAREPPGDDRVQLWVAARGLLWHGSSQLEPLHERTMSSVLGAMALHPAGDRLAVGDGVDLVVLDAHLGRELARLGPAAGETFVGYADSDLRGGGACLAPYLRGVAFSLDGQRLLCGDLAGLTRVFRVGTWELLAAWPGRGDLMGLCAVGEGGEAIVMQFKAPPYRADLERRQVQWTAGPGLDGLGHLWEAWALSPTGERLALFRRYGREAFVLDTRSGRCVARVRVPQETCVTSVAFGRASELFVGTAHGQVFRSPPVAAAARAGAPGTVA